MNPIQDYIIRIIEKNAGFIEANGTPVLISAFILLIVLIFLSISFLKFPWLKSGVVIILLFLQAGVTYITFLVTVPLKPFISLVSTVEKSLNSEIPNLNFLNINDDHFYDLRSFRGKTVILCFWNTGCPLCLEQLADLKKLEAGETGICVIALADQPADTIREFLSQHSYPGITGICPGKHWIDLGIYEPFTILIDRHGLVRDYFYGAKNGELIKNKIQAFYQ